jgi:hypothetical protein
MRHIHVVRSEVTSGPSEGDQGSDVALESLSSQNKPLLIEQASLDFVAADVPLVPLVTLGFVIAIGESRHPVLNHLLGLPCYVGASQAAFNLNKGARVALGRGNANVLTPMGAGR